MRAFAAAAASYAGKYGNQACQSFKARHPAFGIQKFSEGGGFCNFMTESEAAIPAKSGSIATAKQRAHTAPKRLTFHIPKSAGRNSQGRITSFHRGGGAKQLYRMIDVKRNTPSMGVVERVEYDPNRSSRIALVRWSAGAKLIHQRKSRVTEKVAPSSKILEQNTANMQGCVSFSTLSKEVSQSYASDVSSGAKAASLVVGIPAETGALSKRLLTDDGTGSKTSSVRDVISSAFSSRKSATGTAPLPCNSSFSFPRVAVAGAKPAFYAPRKIGSDVDKNTFSLTEIKKWKSNSKIWDHRLKRKAAIPWHTAL